MDKIKEVLLIAGRWLKSRSYATLAAGAAIGAVFDDLVIGFLRAIF